MKALLCKSYASPEHLVLEEVPDPSPGPGEVLIAMRAAGVNFPDALMVQGRYQVKPPLPFTPGSELAGIVAAVGRDVRRFKPGDRVMATSRGAFAEQVVVPADRAWHLPQAVSFEVGAGLLLAYGTAYHALTARGSVRPGETLLVLGAAGGVGLAAVQIGKALGARVIAAASSADKLAVCRANGADALLHYPEEDLRERIRSLTDGKGVDVVFDPVGGRFAEPAFRSMAWRGRYLVVGFADGEVPRLPLNLPLLKGAALVGVYWGAYLTHQPGAFDHDVAAMLKLLEQGALAPRVSARYPLAEGARALLDLLERKVTGKVVLTLGPAAAGH